MEEDRKQIISYFKYAAKQCTIHVLETRSKHIPLLTKQRNFIRRIVVRYFSNIIKVPFGRVLKTWDRDFGCYLKKPRNASFQRLKIEGKTVVIFQSFVLLLSMSKNSPFIHFFCPSETFLEMRVPRSSLQWLSLPNFRLKKKFQRSSRNVLQKTWVSYYKIH